MGFFSRKKDDDFMYETDDFLIVFDDDNLKSDIKRVSHITNEVVEVTGHYKIPLGDCVITVGSNGRNFFYRAPEQSIVETERLAKLEYNTVLSQITAYKPPETHTNIDWTKGMLFGLLFIAFIVVAVVA